MRAAISSAWYLIKKFYERYEIVGRNAGKHNSMDGGNSLEEIVFTAMARCP
jgi:hypothetical protein